MLLPQRPMHVALVVSTAFLAITAIVGGVGLLTGLNAPPTKLLQGSPFTDFSLPGLTLLVAVGGSALTASILSYLRHRSAPLSCLLAGMVIICFEIVEVLAIGSQPGIARDLQIFYFLLGLLISLLAIFQLSRDHRRLTKQ